MRGMNPRKVKSLGPSPTLFLSSHTRIQILVCPNQRLYLLPFTMKSSQNSAHYRDGAQGSKEGLIKGGRLLRKEQVSSDEIEDEGQVRSASIHWEADAHIRLLEVLWSLSSPVSSLLHHVFGPGSTHQSMGELGFSWILGLPDVWGSPNKEVEALDSGSKPNSITYGLCSRQQVTFP